MMIQPMSSLDIRAVVSQMQELVGKRLKKLRLVNSDVYELQLGSSWLIIDLHFGAFLGPSYDWQENGWASVISQVIKNKRIEKIEQVGLDRIIKIDAEDVSLIFELFGGGNLILTKDGIIRRILKPREWKGRSLYAGKEYAYPETLVKIPETEAEFGKLSPTVLVGKRYASKCRTWGEFLELLELSNTGKGTFTDEDYLIGGKKHISRVIYEFYTKIIPEKWKDSKMERINKTIEQQNKIIQDYEEKARKYREKGRYIYDNLVQIDSILKLINAGKWPSGVNIKRRSRYMVTIEL
jgi:predicted ribosome quality control (RQC) complex YloA/Tae2 family protein